MTTMVGETFPLGPGVLKIGATGSELDISCAINNATLGSDKSQDDNVTKLCGTVVPGKTTYTFTLSGNVDSDIGDASGFFAMCMEQKGSQQQFTFTPNTDAGTTATGVLIVDPLDFGGDETETTMASDFEFALVGDPVYAYGVQGP